MPKHTNEEIKQMIQLVEENIKLILRHLEVQPSMVDILTRKIIRKNSKRIATLLNRPYGGTFPPEEIAEVLVSEQINIILKYTSEAAAASVS